MGAYLHHLLRDRRSSLCQDCHICQARRFLYVTMVFGQQSAHHVRVVRSTGEFGFYRQGTEVLTCASQW